jgi:hypothetical protein
MFEPQLVTFARPTTARGLPEPFNLKGASIIIDKGDFAGVHRAANNLAEDFDRVSNGGPCSVVERQNEDVNFNGNTAIIVGTITSSDTIKALVTDGQIQVSEIEGKWESFCTTLVENPACINGCRRALVIAGSDKRGAIFGVYTLSEQIGVSPYVTLFPRHKFMSSNSSHADGTGGQMCQQNTIKTSMQYLCGIVVRSPASNFGESSSMTKHLH